MAGPRFRRVAQGPAPLLRAARTRSGSRRTDRPALITSQAIGMASTVSSRAIPGAPDSPRQAEAKEMVQETAGSVCLCPAEREGELRDGTAAAPTPTSRPLAARPAPGRTPRSTRLRRAARSPLTASARATVCQRAAPSSWLAPDLPPTTTGPWSTDPRASKSSGPPDERRQHHENERDDGSTDGQPVVWTRPLGRGTRLSLTKTERYWSSSSFWCPNSAVQSGYTAAPAGWPARPCPASWAATPCADPVLPRRTARSRGTPERRRAVRRGRLGDRAVERDRAAVGQSMTTGEPFDGRTDLGVQGDAELVAAPSRPR